MVCAFRDELKAKLIEHYGSKKGTALHNKYSRAFPTSYCENCSIKTALFDIECMENLSDSMPLDVSFYRSSEKSSAESLHVKLYQLVSAC